MASKLLSSEPALALGSGAVVNIVTGFLLIVSVLATCARILAKLNSLKRLQGDDVFALLALVFNIGSGVTVLLQVSYGLGRPMIDQDQLEGFMKCTYAMSLLCLAALVSAKLSIVLLLRNISPFATHQRLGFVTGCFTIVWTLVTGFVSAFQCKAPGNWDFARDTCSDRAALWYSIGALSIFTDLILICLPIFIVLGLNMKRSKKWIVVGSFSVRIVDIGVVAIQLRYTSALNSTNVSLDLWPWVLLTQVVQCVTIITSCLPCLHQLLESIPSGMYLSDELRRRRFRGTGSTGEGSRWVWDSVNNQTAILKTTRIATRSDLRKGHTSGPVVSSFQ